jgi:tRNA threonylcarbamoyladenosine biosynthesis protein TsaE
MPEREWITHSAEETIRLGKELGAQLKPPLLILLAGELGAGKTTLTKGLVTGLGAGREEDVTSPTFTLVHQYRNGARVYHIDLYRIADFNDFETLGVEDLFAEPAIIIVEWPEKMSVRSDWPQLRFELEHVDENSRKFRVVDSAGILVAI